MRILSEGDAKALLKTRPENTHKGSFGTVNAVVGCSRYRGAAALAVMGALRSGVGIVRLCSTEKVCDAVTVQYPSATLLPLAETDGGYISAKAVTPILEIVKESDTLLIGCGLGQSHDTKNAVNLLLFASKAKKVIDADGLNMIASSGFLKMDADLLRGCIVTPHVGEMARLMGKTAEEISANMETMSDVAARFSCEYKCITVLKSAITVIAVPGDIGIPEPDFDANVSPESKALHGKEIKEPTSFEERKYPSEHMPRLEVKHSCPDNVRVYVSRRMNSGLSKGGSGDVLAGLIAGLFAQGYTAEQSAILGVWIHSEAARLCAEELSPYAMLPSDLGTYICRVFSDLR